MMTYRTMTGWLVLLAGLFAGQAADVRYRVVRIESPYPDAPFKDISIMLGHGINRYGEVVGAYSGHTETGSQWARPIFHSDATGTIPIDIPEEWDGYASGINETGQIAISVVDTERRQGDDWAFRYTPGVGLEWLEGFGGKTTEAAAINAQGEVAGLSDVPNNDPFAFRYADTTGLTNLGGLYGEGSSARAINDSGWVAGGSAEHAFLFRDDVGLIDLGPGQAWGINNSGWVVGEAFLDNGHPYFSIEAFLYRDEQRILLGRISAPFGQGSTFARDINNSGIVVGRAFVFNQPSNPEIHGMIWSEQEGMRNLNNFIPPESGLYVSRANAINDYGQITGVGAFQEDDFANWGTTFRLDPIPPLLSIRLGVTNVTVFWSPNWPGLVLETASDLTTSSWEPVDTAGTNVLSMPVDSSQRFYRLNQDGIEGLCCVPE